MCFCQSRLYLLRILVGSPLAGKCLSTEQVVASILPDNAAAQTHVLEALCEEGIKSEMLRLQGKVRAELFPVFPVVFFSACLILAVLTACLLNFPSKQRLIEQRGGAGLQSRVDLSFNTSPGTC